ncbi:MAG: fatty acid desaturase [Candidatus Poribacteria bacterium]|nr:fatty acid desaturase [Candidatus Poribacteria bacterium]
MSLLATIVIIFIECYLFYLGQITIHNCAHNLLFCRSKRWNKIVGHVLSSMQLVAFEGWRAAHMLHHRYANSPKDPHHVDRPLIPYILTHYYRIVKALWDPKPFFIAISPPILIALAIIVWQASIGYGTRGLVWVTQFWLIPTIFSQMLVAHFNYIGHVNLPSGRGRDTRSFKHGFWKIVNLFTFNFYHHAEHHLKPSEAIPTPDLSIQ